jgi:hypothetical protein
MLVLVRPEGLEALGPFAESELDAVAYRELVRSVGGADNLPAGFDPAWSVTNLIGSDYRILTLVPLEV